MSVKFHTIARTAKIVKPYAVEQRPGRNGVFESRMVMFSIATDREYRQAITHADGTISQERKTDFFVCRATGPIADLFAKYCSATKKDENGNDKLVSRRIAIEGHLEKYPATRTETITANVNGQNVQLQVQLPEEREILVVESIEFLDANPVNKANAEGGNAIVATVAQPVAPVAQTAVPVQAVAQATPIAPVVVEANAEVAPF